MLHMPKTSKTPIINPTNIEEPSRWVLNSFFFSSVIILIFGSLFTHCLYRLLKVK